MSQRIRLFVILAVAALGLTLAGWFALSAGPDATGVADSGMGAPAAETGAAPQAGALLPGAEALVAAARQSGEAGSTRGQGGLRGRVLLTDRTPLPDAEVVAYRSQHSIWRSPYRALTERDAAPPVVRLATMHTGSDGRFVFTGLPAETPLVLAVAPRTGRSTLRFVERTPHAAETVDLGDILLPRGSGVTGRIVDPQGQPLQWVRVRALDALEHMDFDAAMDGFAGEGAVALHSRGAASVPVLSKLPLLGNLFVTNGGRDAEVAEARAKAQRDQVAWLNDQRAEAEFAARKAEALALDERLVLKMAGDRMVRAERNAALTAVRSLPPWCAALERELPAFPETTTDAEGRFVLEGVSATRLRLWLHRRGSCAVRAGPFHSSEGGLRDVGTLTLQPARTVTAEVVDATGRPVAGAEALAGPADGPDGLRFLSPAGRTDPDGRFQADAPPQGQVVFAVRRAADEPWHAHGPVPVGDAAVRITLPVLPDLTVQVVTADGKPVPGAELRVTSAVRTRGGEGSFVPLWPRVPIERDATAFRLHRIPDEPLRVVASAPGFVPGGVFWSTAELKPEAPPELRLTLTPATAGVLRVLARGSEEPQAQVRVFASPEALGPAAALFPLADPFLLGATDARGELKLSGLPAGTSPVLLQHPRLGWMRAQVALPGDLVLVLFDLPGAIAGRVLDGSAPPREPVRVALRPERDDAPIQDEGHWILVPVAGDGTFRVGGLMPGSYHLAAAPDPGHVSSLHAHLDLLISSSPTAEQTAVVQAGKDTQVVLHLFERPEDVPVGRIQGRVRVDGQPLPDLEVLVEGAREAQTLTDESGGFVLDRVAADCDLTLSVHRRTDGGQLPVHAQQVRVAPNQSLDVDIQVELALVRVRVVQAGSGVPVPRLRFVLARQADAGPGGVSQDGVSDEQGLATLRVPTGAYAVAVQSGGWTLGRSDPIQLGRGSQDLRLEVVPAFRIAGRVEVAGGSPKGAVLRFHGRATGHDQRVGVRPDKSGAFQFRTGELPADTYEVTLTTRRDCAPVERIVTGSQRDLVLQFQPGSAGK